MASLSNLKEFEYLEYLQNECDAFKYIRDLANCVKHMKLDKRFKPSTSMEGLSNTGVAQGDFNNDFSNDFFVDGLIISHIPDSPPIYFADAADNVKAMWDRLFIEYGWA